MDGEVFRVAEVIEEVEFLPEGGAPGRVIEPEEVELGFGPRPCFLDDPGLLLSPSLQGEEPLEAVDEEEPPSVVDDHQGVVGVGVGGDLLGPEELGGDVCKGDFPHAHGRSPVFATA